MKNEPLQQKELFMHHLVQVLHHTYPIWIIAVWLTNYQVQNDKCYDIFDFIGISFTSLRSTNYNFQSVTYTTIYISMFSNELIP